jgi:hypothetical protein
MKTLFFAPRVRCDGDLRVAPDSARNASPHLKVMTKSARSLGLARPADLRPLALSEVSHPSDSDGKKERHLNRGTSEFSA